MKGILLIVMVVATLLLGPLTALSADECREVTAANRRHANAGRAHFVAGDSGCGSFGYYAVGSEEFLGVAAIARTTLNTSDNGRSYQRGKCPVQDTDEDDDIDQDGYPSDQDCNGADAKCTLPPSCIDDLKAWKTPYKPKPSNCTACHTRCTYGGAKGVHSCIEGEDWGVLNCLQCHPNIHK
jgi:hypothetical protein